MGIFKRYFVVMLIAFFTVAASGSVAMAHCGNSEHGRDSAGIAKKMDGCNHIHSTKEKKHDDHKNIDKKTHGSYDADHNDSTHSRGEGQTSSCIDCGAGLCHTQNIVTAETSAVFYVTLKNLHIEKVINPEAVYIAIIPDPPNHIS
ncbi:hypothetical protein MNBD_DELTA02-656 [hydrothermal vent metagenome]|uniref:Uncharacterized protein n=1 Tax=hydrothermal vent metagenome TaxID=652676 RepID=A0A3B0V0W3_9ZZZZ